MAHPLDRPIWSALATRQAPLALGGPHARRFDPDYGVFAAADGSPEGQVALAELVRAHGQAALVEAEDPRIPDGLTLLSRGSIWQMSTQAFLGAEPVFPWEVLAEADAPAMRTLVALTEPGPFSSRTHQLGRFVGVKVDGQLVAMAGERMRPEGFTEISGVCTHPDHRGHGYAGGLMHVVASRILATGETAFLHVYAHNRGAIGLYEALGFALRREMSMVMVGPA